MSFYKNNNKKVLICDLNEYSDGALFRFAHIYQQSYFLYEYSMFFPLNLSWVLFVLSMANVFLYMSLNKREFSNLYGQMANQVNTRSVSPGSSSRSSIISAAAGNSSKKTLGSAKKNKRAAQLALQSSPSGFRGRPAGRIKTRPHSPGFFSAGSLSPDSSSLDSVSGDSLS